MSLSKALNHDYSSRLRCMNGTSNAGKVTGSLWRRCSEPHATENVSGPFVSRGRWTPRQVYLLTSGFVDLQSSMEVFLSLHTYDVIKMLFSDLMRQIFIVITRQIHIVGLLVFDTSKGFLDPRNLSGTFSKLYDIINHQENTIFLIGRL